MKDEDIQQILKNAKTIAIVGISNKPERDSHKVAVYLQEHGYQIIAVNPLLAGTQIVNEKCYASLTEAKEQTGLTIDIVDCFRKSEDIMPIAIEAVKIQAKCLWMQLSIVNEEAAALAKDNDIVVVMDKCTKIEHKKIA